ncbi:MAG: alkaline phosphatase family protein [Ferruginibacter sp.]
MKILILFVFFASAITSKAQSDHNAPNFFIITTDGFRWQEIFNGADSVIINNPSYVRDTALLKEMYWDNNPEERRKMLMPFVWKTLLKAGTIYGNRKYDNKVTIANAYRFSYPGYNEILTGYADPAIKSNRKKVNHNENLLSVLNNRVEYKNKVAAFASWNLFEYILNEKQAGFYVNSGYQPVSHDSLSETEQLANAVQANTRNNFQSTRNDMLTFVTAKEYIQNMHPKIVFISFGETDEYAHGGNYDGYLQSAHLFDEYLAQLWYLINKDPFYKNNTSFIITTDHGRGQKGTNWIRHGIFTPGSNCSWLITAGKGFEAKGELKNKNEIFNDQLAQTVAEMLGFHFDPPHPVADQLSISAPLKISNTGLTLR